jgi:hypothetical protein
MWRLIATNPTVNTDRIAAAMKYDTGTAVLPITA